MQIIIKDDDLTTISQLEERFQSICRQIEKLDNIHNPRNFDKHHNKYMNFVNRRDTISTRIWRLKRS